MQGGHNRQEVPRNTSVAVRNTLFGWVYCGAMDAEQQMGVAAKAVSAPVVTCYNRSNNSALPSWYEGITACTSEGTPSCSVFFSAPLSLRLCPLSRPRWSA